MNNNNNNDNEVIMILLSFVFIIIIIVIIIIIIIGRAENGRRGKIPVFSYWNICIINLAHPSSCEL